MTMTAMTTMQYKRLDRVMANQKRLLVTNALVNFLFVGGIVASLASLL